jgi:hypothetical protein
MTKFVTLELCGTPLSIPAKRYSELKSYGVQNLKLFISCDYIFGDRHVNYERRDVLKRAYIVQSHVIVGVPF